MKLIHRIGFNADGAEVAAFREAGVEVSTGFGAFEIEEVDPRWPAVSALVAQRKLLDTLSTKFTRAEIRNAPYMDITPSWHHGYPQPDGDHGWREVTYDLSNWCEHCDLGKRQNAPFRMKSEPKWGSRNVLQLNWVFDEYFTTPDFWQKAFEPLGVKSGPVLRAKDLTTLPGVVQLMIEDVVDVDTTGLPYVTCDRCNRIKYAHVTRGFGPLPLGNPNGLVRSRQEFGSDHSAYHRIIASTASHEVLVSAGVKGVDFRPCGPTGDP
jgi:hypothetical protein